MHKFTKIAIVKIIKYCNQDCIFCHEAVNFDNKSMSVDDIKKIIKVLKKERYDSVLLSGGEPFLHPQINEIIYLFHQNNIKINIISNGSLIHNINPQILRLISRFYISLHADNEKNNYFLTRRMSFSVVMANIRKLSRSNKEIIIRFTINNLNKSSLSSFVSLISPLLGKKVKLELAFLEIKGRLKKGSKLIPKTRELIKLLNFFSHKNNNIIFDAVPLCIFSGQKPEIDDFIYKIRLRIHKDKEKIVFLQAKDKKKQYKLCKGCKDSAKCLGWPLIFNKEILANYASKYSSNYKTMVR